MASKLSSIKMEYEMDSISLGAFWLPSFEADSLNSFVTDSEGYDGSINTAEHRRKLASRLLETLEGSEKNNNEPYCGWLEEPMDLEVFGQSIVEPTPSIPLDDDFISAPSSPLVSSFPPTPIQPASPQELYPSQDDFPIVKFEESVTAIPVENNELLESLEMLLHEIQSQEAAASLPVEQVIVKEDEADVASALLDSLIKGDVEESQVLDELAEFSLALMDAEVVEQILPTSSVPPTSPSESSDDQEWLPSSAPAARKNRAGTSQPVQRKARAPRKKSLKTEDRRLRKKEQNKTAATRYRIKKKVELEILLEEEALLEQRNRQLQERHDELASEIRYLKNLMREVFVKSGKRRP